MKFLSALALLLAVLPPAARAEGIFDGYEVGNARKARGLKAGKAKAKKSGKGAPPSSTARQADAVRAQLKLYKDSLETDLELDRGYHPSAADQIRDYHFCTIVQQCAEPPFILSLGLMPPRTRGHAYNALSRAMSAESFNMLLLQQHGNLLLGEMQDWGTT